MLRTVVQAVLKSLSRLIQDGTRTVSPGTMLLGQEGDWIGLIWGLVDNGMSLMLPPTLKELAELTKMPDLSSDQQVALKFLSVVLKQRGVVDLILSLCGANNQNREDSLTLKIVSHQ